MSRKTMSKPNYNTKKDVHFDKINKLLSGGKYEHSMDKHIDAAHASLIKDKLKDKKD